LSTQGSVAGKAVKRSLLRLRKQQLQIAWRGSVLL